MLLTGIRNHSCYRRAGNAKGFVVPTVCDVNARRMLVKVPGVEAEDEVAGRELGAFEGLFMRSGPI